MQNLVQSLKALYRQTCIQVQCPPFPFSYFGLNIKPSAWKFMTEKKKQCTIFIIYNILQIFLTKLILTIILTIHYNDIFNTGLPTQYETSETTFKHFLELLYMTYLMTVLKSKILCLTLNLLNLNNLRSSFQSHIFLGQPCLRTYRVSQKKCEQRDLAYNKEFFFW